MAIIKIIYIIDACLKDRRPDINTLFHDMLIEHGVDTTILDFPKNNNERVFYSKQKIMAKNLIALQRYCKNCRQTNKTAIVQTRNLLFFAVVALIISKIYKMKFCYWLSFPVVEATDVWIDRNKESASFLIKMKKVLKRELGSIVLYKILLNAADHVFVQSENMKDNISQKGIDKNKMTSVPMGIDEQLAEKAFSQQKKIAVQNENRVILYVGALDRERQIEIILGAFKRTLKNVDNIVLRIIGDAVEYGDINYLKGISKNIGISNKVEFIHNITREKVFEYILNADIGISAIPPIDIYECSSPTKLIEYLSLGLPTVANRVADQEMMMQITGGGICVDFTEKEFERAILDILKNDVYKENLVKNGRYTVMNLRGYKNISKNVAKAYKNI